MISLSIVGKTYTFAKALLTGKNVNSEQLEVRLKICRNCDRVRPKGQIMRCDVCGCQLKDSGLVNLARFVETKDYGCKHPTGSRWKAAGV